MNMIYDKASFDLSPIFMPCSIDSTFDTTSDLVVRAKESPTATAKHYRRDISMGQRDKRLNKCRSRESNTGLVHGKHEFYH
jgi:hypothetical protein